LLLIRCIILLFTDNFRDSNGSKNLALKKILLEDDKVNKGSVLYLFAALPSVTGSIREEDPSRG
jgi:hypothetical protein